MRLERHPAVIAEDLPDIYTFTARDNPAAAERLLDAIELSFAQLTRQPDCGVTYRSRNRNLAEMRMLPVAGSQTISYSIESRPKQFGYSTWFTARGICRAFSRRNFAVNADF